MVSLPLQDADLILSPKRRRLQSKQPCLAVTPPKQAAVKIYGSLWSNVTASHFEASDRRRKYKIVYNKFEFWFASDPACTFREDAWCSQELWNLARSDYQILTKPQKSLVLRFFLDETSCPDFVLHFAMTQWLGCDKNRKASMLFQSSTVLLTYQGDCFVMDLSPSVVESLSDVAMLVEFAQKLPAAQELCTAFKLHSEQLSELLGATAHCFGVEICLDTWSEESILRLHGHLFLKHSDKKLRAQNKKPLFFRDSEPHLKTQLWGKQCSRGNWAGAYYCLAPKLGALFQGGSVKPFKDFPVSPEWIFNLVESSKITYENAREQLVSCGKGLTRRLQDLETWHKHKQQLLLADKVEKRQEEIRKTLQPFPKWPIVMSWLKQNSASNMPRKQFMVLDGPSKLGKTQFVKDLFPPGKVLELNCAGLTSVCLPGFNALEHQCLFWDEGSPKLVAQNRKVFQHPCCWVDLGHSPTAQHVYKVYLNDCMSVVATNSWHEEMSKLSRSDQDWLVENSLVLKITMPLWEAPPEPAEEALIFL